MKKVIVFGGAGFLGKPVVSELFNAGYQVTIFDQKCPSDSVPCHRIILGDILDQSAVDEACADADYVYNYAGIADINDAKDKPLATVQLNILGNLNVLEGCRKAGVKRFVYASSLYVYSESGSFYRASKQASERYVELYFQKYGLAYTILRYGSLYGNGADHRNNIYRLIKQAFTDGRMSYPGTGEELREYIHVIDAAKASVQILSDEFANQNIVLTGMQQLRIKDLMQMIAEIIGENIEICFSAIQQEYHYNITPYTYRPRIGIDLKVPPTVTLEETLQQCFADLSQAKKWRTSTEATSQPSTLV